MSDAEIGLIGLAVMGQNLALNIVDHGYSIAVFNRTLEKVDEFIKTNPNKNIYPTYSINELVNKLIKPRKIILLVKAGEPVDQFIEAILPKLDSGDIIIDAGNSNYKDTIRRYNKLSSKNILFVGTGVSGGEEGARNGPSIMPGGSKDAWPYIKDIFQSISAKVNNEPCCNWVGNDGAGHFVKMVHNGIEYGDMELISEAYQIMRIGLKMDSFEISEVFKKWNKGKLDSYLIEITADILSKKDETGKPIIDIIVDKAGQKGTGMWTVISSLELGTSVSLIGEAVFQRNLSSFKKERIHASKALTSNSVSPIDINSKTTIINEIENALYASKIISYSQGFNLMKIAAKQYNWKLNYGNIALLWRGGCIIRSVFLGKIKEAFDKDPNIENLLLNPFFKKEIELSENSWRNLVSNCFKWGIPIPGFSTALSYFDSYRTETLPANLIQAQRDYFGAHGYEKFDDEEGKLHHTIWKNLN